MPMCSLGYSLSREFFFSSFFFFFPVTLSSKVRLTPGLIESLLGFVNSFFLVAWAEHTLSWGEYSAFLTSFCIAIMCKKGVSTGLLTPQPKQYATRIPCWKGEFPQDVGVPCGRWLITAILYFATQVRT